MIPGRCRGPREPKARAKARTTDAQNVLTRLAYRIHHQLERYFPEQRLFLKSDHDTRFIRLRPVTQVIAVVGGTLALAWTIVATALIMMDSIGDRKSTRLNSSHRNTSRMPSSA